MFLVWRVCYQGYKYQLGHYKSKENVDEIMFLNSSEDLYESSVTDMILSVLYKTLW